MRILPLLVVLVASLLAPTPAAAWERPESDKYLTTRTSSVAVSVVPVTGWGLTYGFGIEAGRYRWRSFNLGIFKLAVTGRSDDSWSFLAGFLALGPKWHLPDPHHEFGFMVWVFGVMGAVEEEQSSIGWFPTTFYYRLNCGWMFLEFVEIGVTVSPLWKTNDRSKPGDFYSTRIPLMVHLTFYAR